MSAHLESRDDQVAALVRRVRTPEQVRELVALVAAGYRLESAVWDAHGLRNVAGIDRGDLPGCTFGLLDLEDLALEIDDQHDGAGALRALACSAHIDVAHEAMALPYADAEWVLETLADHLGLAIADRGGP